MILQGIIVVIYTVSLLLILMYAIAQLNLLINYLSAKKKIAHCPVFDFENPENNPGEAYAKRANAKKPQIKILKSNTMKPKALTTTTIQTISKQQRAMRQH